MANEKTYITERKTKKGKIIRRKVTIAEVEAHGRGKKLTRKIIKNEPA